MALAKTTKRKFKPKKRISTDAITHSYTYRQITMSRDNETIGSDLGKGSRPVSATKQHEITVEDVLMWEAT